MGGGWRLATRCRCGADIDESMARANNVVLNECTSLHSDCASAKENRQEAYIFGAFYGSGVGDRYDASGCIDEYSVG